MIHQETQRFRRNSSVSINRIRVSVCFCTLKQSGSIVQYINTILNSWSPGIYTKEDIIFVKVRS
ncbi:hypothetical protein Hanom_Chr09g00835541 [Helianthus anomalus]